MDVALSGTSGPRLGAMPSAESSMVALARQPSWSRQEFTPSVTPFRPQLLLVTQGVTYAPRTHPMILGLALSS
ncbi:hypothetical protein ACN42_g7492 [Penicillium freii]|uniref:Uncharacterized protein n=1 Tax=Penicillium freii TaxID=48697 RepID=A0A101MFN8_PENFR|nr:hypothetical protein ACN42_g7492 [Penicillium freii]